MAKETRLRRHNQGLWRRQTGLWDSKEQLEQKSSQINWRLKFRRVRKICSVILGSSQAKKNLWGKTNFFVFSPGLVVQATRTHGSPPHDRSNAHSHAMNWWDSSSIEIVNVATFKPRVGKVTIWHSMKKRRIVIYIWSDQPIYTVTNDTTYPRYPPKPLFAQNE